MPSGIAQDRRGCEMGILNKVFGNTRKPQGRIGKMMAKSMNSGHAKMADWGMAFLADVEASSICDFTDAGRVLSHCQ